MTKLYNHQEQEQRMCHLWFLLWCSKPYHYLFILAELTEHSAVSSATPRFSSAQLRTLMPACRPTRPRPLTTDLWAVGGQWLIAPGHHDWRRKERHFPRVRLFLQSGGEQQCHDSALGPVHSLSCDDVTDGIFTFISHNKGKVMPKCITVAEALFAQLGYSGYKQSFG